MSRKLIDPFNEKVRERIFGFGSRMSTSGSEHEADINDVVSSASSSSTCSAVSPRLSFLVQNFLEASGDQSDDTGESNDDDDDEDSDPTALIRDVVNPIVRINKDRFRTALIAHVTKAAEMFSLFRQNPAVFNRNVIAFLREIGYNSGICKTKWEAAPEGSLIGGTYEFIDVVRDDFGSEKNSRYVVDLNFGAQFEVARETVRYRSVLGALPKVFVGNCEDLKRIVRIMADELRRSMKMSRMSLPPWRKNRYMQAKWFGPYRRTVNQLPNSAAVSSFSVVQCRSVGFFASDVDGGRLAVAPPTTRTRYIA